MLIIGLTGGIGSGKTTAANYFAELGVPIIDADVIARDITADKAISKKIISHFGDAVVDQHQQLDRRRLREIVFADLREREWLEQLLHPLIAQAIQQHIKVLKAAYCILVIPLLLEKDRRIKVDRVLVIDTTEVLQAERTQQRDRISFEQFQVISQTQLNRPDRLSQADDVIINNGALEMLKQQIATLHQRYLTLAQAYE